MKDLSEDKIVSENVVWLPDTIRIYPALEELFPYYLLPVPGELGEPGESLHFP
jgi:hypothetical protein